jgi:hypothetical protein
MKTLKRAMLLALVIAGTFAAESALAWNHSRVVVGVGIGVPVGVPYYGYYGYGAYPYYYPPYYPSPVVVQQQPTVYVEQQPASQGQATGYWYYCGDSRAYYPYVKECPSGWQRVAPQPQQ